MPVNSFGAVAFDDNWYLGQLVELCSPEEADINYMKRVGQSYFQWPSPPDLKKTKAIYVTRSTKSRKKSGIPLPANPLQSVSRGEFGFVDAV